MKARGFSHCSLTHATRCVERLEEAWARRANEIEKDGLR